MKTEVARCEFVGGPHDGMLAEPESGDLPAVALFTLVAPVDDEHAEWLLNFEHAYTLSGNRADGTFIYQYEGYEGAE